jgi:type IV secretory pathway TraG/TraD family ATPase VirD4
MQRPLITPDETMRLPEEAALIFAPGSPPIYGAKIRYYLDQEFSARAKLAPPQHSDQVGSGREWQETPVSVTNLQDQNTNQATDQHSVTEPEREQVRRDSRKEWLFK